MSTWRGRSATDGDEKLVRLSTKHQHAPGELQVLGYENRPEAGHPILHVREERGRGSGITRTIKPGFLKLQERLTISVGFRC